MWGSATLAIVLSSACISVAIMVQPITSVRWRVVNESGFAGADISVEIGKLARVPGIDVDGHAHSGSDHLDVFTGIEGDANGKPLYDLDPIRARVLRRQDGEGRVCGRRDRDHASLPYLPGIAVDGDL